MDVDGTLTDGKIYMSPTGEAMKAFNIKDGCGIHDVAIPAGIIPVVFTGRQSDIVTKRCSELGITQMYQGIINKKSMILEVSNGELMGQVAYIGDDINDLDCMRTIKKEGGLIGCPADAVKKVKEIADYISPHKGGDGAVRDFIDWIVSD